MKTQLTSEEFGKRVTRRQDLGDYIYRVNKPLRVFKKVIVHRTRPRRVYAKAIATLEIPAGAYLNSTDSYYFDTKMRATSAKVISIKKVTGGGYVKRARSLHSAEFTYRPGEVVRPVKPFSYSCEECASGIHFFRSWLDARSYC